MFKITDSEKKMILARRRKVQAEEIIFDSKAFKTLATRYLKHLEGSEYFDEFEDYLINIDDNGVNLPPKVENYVRMVCALQSKLGELLGTISEGKFGGEARILRNINVRL